MIKEKYSIEALQKFLEREKVSTIDQLKRVLGTSVRMTVFRKLTEIGYQTSYSHNAKFYALKRLCEFDEDGLWSYQNVWFSVYGTLLEAGRTIINRSTAGYSVAELDKALHVSTKQSLLHLHKKALIDREKVVGIFVYFSSDKTVRKKQLLERRELTALQPEDLGADVLADELKAAIILFYSLLDQRQRRFFAGLESLQIGGDAKVARILGIDPHTVSKGRNQLLTQDKSDGARKPGAGRQPVEKKHQK